MEKSMERFLNKTKIVASFTRASIMCRAQHMKFIDDSFQIIRSLHTKLN